jgi:hypothetical protein
VQQIHYFSADYLKNNSREELLLYKLHSFYRKLGGPRGRSESSGGAHNVNVTENSVCVAAGNTLCYSV